MVAQNLERDNVQQALEAVDGLGHPDSLDACGDTVVARVAQDNGLRLARGDLGKGGLDLGVERVLGHDDDHGHILVDQGERTVLELSSEDTWSLDQHNKLEKDVSKELTLRVHIADFLDLECTLQASGVSNGKASAPQTTKMGM